MMKAKLTNNVTVKATVLAACLVAVVTSTRADEDLKAQAAQTIQTFTQKDPTIEKFLDTSAGYVVFPGVGEGGLIVGGAHGKGVVYEKGKPIGQATLSKATIGAQIGGQSFAEIIVFQTPESLQDFKKGNFEVSAGVSAVVVNTGAAQNANYRNGVAVFTLPKGGAMAQAAVGGQKFKFEPFNK